MTLAPSRNAGASGLHVRHEKAGLIFDTVPIPWNADVVIVEANVKLPAAAPRDKQQFTLHLSAESQPTAAELCGKSADESTTRVFFRCPVPTQSSTAEVRWRDHSLGQIDLPLLTAAEFVGGLALQPATIHADLGKAVVACQSVVASQCRALVASALLTSVSPLAPIAELGLHASVERSDGERMSDVPVALTANQMRSRQSLLTAMLPKIRRAGTYHVRWRLGSKILHELKLAVVSKVAFQRSLRISSTRFILEGADGAMRFMRWIPERDGQLQLDGVARIGPCFHVCSGIAGMAGIAKLRVDAFTRDDAASPIAIEQEMVVTDGPAPLLAGMVTAGDLARIEHFALSVGGRKLGVLPLTSALSAQFTGEGGFAPLEEFLWSPAADEQLDERLGKLLGGA